MRTTKVILVGALLLAAPAANAHAFAAESHHAPASKGGGYHAVLRLNRGGVVPHALGPREEGTPTFIRGRNGSETVVSAVETKLGGGHVLYLHRSSDSAPWRSHRVAKSGRGQAAYGVASYLSANGQRVLTLISQCSGLQLLDTGVDAGAPSRPVLAPGKFQAPDTCAADGDATKSSAGAVGTGGGHFDVLARRRGSGSLRVDHYSGHARLAPGHQLNPHGSASGCANPGITRDPATREILVVCGNEQGNHLRIWSKRPHRAWHGPKRVAGPASSEATVQRLDLAAVDGRVVVVLGAAVPGPIPGGLFAVRRSKGGRWKAPVHLPHTGQYDTSAIVAPNPRTGAFHVIWGRSDTTVHHKRGGVLHEALVHGKWRFFRHLSHSPYDDAVGLAITRAGHPIVAYTHS